MKHLLDKEYWSKTYTFGDENVYALERIDRSGFVFVLFRDHSKHTAPKREKQKLSGNLRVRDSKGRIDKTRVKAVDNAVAKFAAQLRLGQRPDESRKQQAMTLHEGFEKLLDIGTGKYPARNLRWQEVERARKKLERILGMQKTWLEIKPGDARFIWRKLANEYMIAEKGVRACGPRQTEVTVDALYSVANWLRDEGLIPLDAALPVKNWRAKLKREWEQIVGKDVVPERRRHTTEELGRLFRSMHHSEVDPRFALAFDLGGEQRIGQVLRCKRSNLDLGVPNGAVPIDGSGSLGTLRVPGAGHKAAAPIVLTPNQRTAVDSALTGYLLDYETAWLAGAIDDYPLFPAGRFKRGKAKVVGAPLSLTRDAALGMFHDLERISGVESLPGRGWYGVRRTAADLAEDVEKDERVLNSITGHRDSTTRRLVYQDRQRPAVLNKAAQTRDKVRQLAVEKTQPEEAPIELLSREKSA
jgi:integrase